METEIILFIVYLSIVGACIGTFSGLMPGVHVNTLSALMLTFYPNLEEFLSTFIPPDHIPVCVASCVISAAIVHSFVDFVPSVFIGAPDPDDVLSMLPGHRLLSEGKGMVAVRSAAIGSAVGACASIAIAIPMQYLLIIGLGEYLDSLTVAVLLIVLLVMIFHESTIGKGVWALILIILSGLLGYFCMNIDIPCKGLFGYGNILFPLLTGLFGMPALLQSLKKTKLTKQTDDERYPVGPIPGIKGVITGCITGWFPGITATAGAIVSSTVTPEKRPEGFISMIASIGTASAVMMLITMSVSGKGRSGTMLVIRDILNDSVIGFMNPSFLLLLFSVAIATLLGYNLTIFSGKMMSSLISKIDIVTVNRFSIILVVSLVALMTGPFGLIILAISTIMGFLPISAEISRVHLTGCLIFPTLLNLL